MNLNELAAKVTIFLTPFLPFFVIGGETIAKELGERFGQAVFDKAKLIWNRIKGASADSDFKYATMALVENPQSTPFQLALSTALGNYLEKHPEEARKIASLMTEGDAIQSILIEREGEVDNILQELNKAGRQDVIVKGKAKDVTQKQ